MRSYKDKVAMMGLTLALALPAGAQSGRITHESVLLGLHFLHARSDCNTTGAGAVNVSASIFDYIDHMPEDIARMSYADFWHWWQEFERYKGDEKGLADMDRVVDACLSRGMKVKVDLAWSTWWTNDKDWEKEALTPIGPVDRDDWIHLCDLLGRRYRGRIALWLLQGESNDMKGYWQGAPLEHVHEVFRTGYRAFKRVDPGVMISIAGASPSAPRKDLDEWVRVHATACKGLFDDIPLNYFADVVGGDQYWSMREFYTSVRKILASLGQTQAEIGSGESSFQWALDSYAVKAPPPPWKPSPGPTVQPALSEEGQAWRCNQSLGEFFELGGNKFMFWGTEFAPGGGWPWRWGLRKYQDWWGIWPETHKVPGTNIVYRYDNPDGRKVDLRPGWTSPPSDPYHPIWQVFKFWAQATPPGAEAVRMPAEVKTSRPHVFSLATYMRAEDRCVVLVQADERTSLSVDLPLAVTGWPDGSALKATIRNEAIDYRTGAHSVRSEAARSLKIVGGHATLDIPPSIGFTTIFVAPDRPALAAECVSRHLLGRPVVGKPVGAVVVLRNTGAETWAAGAIRVGLAGPDEKGRAWAIPTDVAPGSCASVTVKLPPSAQPEYVTHFLRMRDRRGREFGPLVPISATVSAPDAPRKLVAFRELGHVRLKWFAPERDSAVASYAVERADAFDRAFRPLSTVTGSEYMDADLLPDRPYYYRVVAIDARGRRSRPSNEDNARALSNPWTWDAEVVSHTAPERMKLGQSKSVQITLRNTGRKTWDLTNSEGGTRFRLMTTQLWGEQNEAQLPCTEIAGTGRLEPGHEITLTLPYAPIRAGRFENHWVLTMETKASGRAYFGTPLLVETVVTE